jgi:hypothetical protein
MNELINLGTVSFLLSVVIFYFAELGMQGANDKVSELHEATERNLKILEENKRVLAEQKRINARHYALVRRNDEVTLTNFENLGEGISDAYLYSLGGIAPPRSEE